jgi:glycosyltransferase involved in cell wall biosynthesis
LLQRIKLHHSHSELRGTFPKLLYLGDVPVESTVFGAALLYRLLAEYSNRDLLVLEANPWRSRLDRRLTAIRYGAFPLGNSRLLNSRLHTLYGSWLFWRVRSKWRRIDPWCKPFTPQAVVTVTHGYSWLAAAEYAFRKKLPLHLILHDDWPGQNVVLNSLRPRAQRLLEYYYHKAASRLCISPAMADVYRDEFSMPATVLYPCSGPDAERWSGPPERVLRDVPHPVIGFGGTVSGLGQARTMRAAARALSECGGKLLIYGPLRHERSRALGLDLPNIELRGLVNSAAMVRSFRETTDALLVPQSFLERDRRQTIMSFPSKVADYTAAALPLLILAPEYSSVVQWAGSNGAMAEIVTVEDVAALRAAIERIVSSAQHRLRLATRSLEVHQQYFSHGNAWRTLCHALQAGDQHGRD